MDDVGVGLGVVAGLGLSLSVLKTNVELTRHSSSYWLYTHWSRRGLQVSNPALGHTHKHHSLSHTLGGNLETPADHVSEQ